jgi:hypothetical protein
MQCRLIRGKGSKSDPQQASGGSCHREVSASNRRVAAGTANSVPTTTTKNTRRQVAPSLNCTNPSLQPPAHISRHTSDASSSSLGGSRPRHSRARPPASSSGSKVGLVEPSSWFGTRRLRIGIESEFILTPRRPEDAKHHLKELWKAVAKEYHAEVGKSRPRLLDFSRPYHFRGSYDTWCFVLDPSLSTTDTSSSKLHHAERMIGSGIGGS